MKKQLTAISFIFIVQFSFGQELMPYQENGKFGFKDSVGNVIVLPRYDYYGYGFFDNLMVVNTGGKVSPTDVFGGGKWGFINTKGKEVIPCKYDNVRDFSEGLAVVNIGGEFGTSLVLGGKYGYIDTTGKEVVPLRYDDANDFSEGLAPVVLNGKCGYINKKGKEVIPFKYNVAGKFSEGLAVVSIGNMETGKWGFIGKNGKEIIPLKYDYAESFKNGKAEVMLNGKSFFIDKTGKEIKTE